MILPKNHHHHHHHHYHHYHHHHHHHHYHHHHHHHHHHQYRHHLKATSYHIILNYIDIPALQTIHVNNADDGKITMLKVELQASKWNRVDSSKYYSILSLQLYIIHCILPLQS